MSEKIVNLNFAVELYWQTICGSRDPDPIFQLAANWQAKRDELEKFGKVLKFDFWELGKIYDSAKNKLDQGFSPRFSEDDPIQHTAVYLRHRRNPSTPSIFTCRWTDNYLNAAKDKGDADFFIRLGKELRRQEAISKNELQRDSLKFFFAFLWQPRNFYNQDSSGNCSKMFWRGLAYMTNPAKMQAWEIYKPNRAKSFSDDKWAFIKKWQRLGLVSAHRPLVKKIICRQTRLLFE